MRRLALPLALALGLLVAGSVSAGSKSALTGDWIGNDPAPPVGDGSVVHLSINVGGERAQITFTDEYGTVCENEGSPVTFFRSTLSGIVLKDAAIVATFKSAHCGPVNLAFLQGELMVLQLNNQGNNDPSDDTLSDGTVTWHRV